MAMARRRSNRTRFSPIVIGAAVFSIVSGLVFAGWVASRDPAVIDRFSDDGGTDLGGSGPSATGGGSPEIQPNAGHEGTPIEFDPKHLDEFR